jgi:hypothetical protein
MPANPPAGPDPRLKGARVFLSDLQEFDSKGTLPGWTFGKGGQLGNRNRALIMVKGLTSPKGLSTHPPSGRRYARVCYALGQRASTLQGAVAISDGEPFPLRFPLRYLILGDGKVLWRSEPLKDKNVQAEFNVDVSAVHILELRVYVDGISGAGANAVWVDPYVMVKP